MENTKQEDFIKKIRKQYSDVIINDCSDEGCKLNLNGISNFVILEGEKTRKEGKRSDRIIFINDKKIQIVILELKNKSVKSSEVIA
jgi:hypothetical protein